LVVTAPVSAQEMMTLSSRFMSASGQHVTC
jgi:hypothetical protein